MAFSYTVGGQFAISRAKKLVYGTFTNAAADAGGDVVTGLHNIDCFLHSVNSHLGGEVIKASTSGGTATLVTSEGVDGAWIAIGL